MKTILRLSNAPNIWGSLASSICLLHCLATPFLFAAQAGHIHGHHEHPAWWGMIDILFLIISFVAVFWSSRTTSKQWMKYALWISWLLLGGIIINEKVGVLHLLEEAIYIPSLALIVLHLYNRKFCKCADKNDSCCV